MIAFRKRPDMLVLFPKRQLADYMDNSMPRRDWSKYLSPAERRLPARSVCARQFAQNRERKIA